MLSRRHVTGPESTDDGVRRRQCRRGRGLTELGVRRAVGEQGRFDECRLIDLRPADLTGAIGARTQTLEGAIDIVENRLDARHTRIVSLYHDSETTRRFRANRAEPVTKVTRDEIPHPRRLSK